jgi:hypothetical protein
MNKTIILLVLLGLFATAAMATDYFVATTGDDAANGSQTTPFKTLGKAKAAVSALLQSSGDAINVYVRAGTYYLDSTLLFTPQDGGTAARPVTYSAFQNEKVILSGGRKITPTWSTYSGNIQVAAIGTGYNFDMLFLNDDKLLIMARWPNFDSTKILQGCGDYTSRISLWKNPAGGFLRAIHVYGWGSNSFKITGVSGGKPTVQWAGDNNRGQGINPTETMVENIFEELDAPGEWFYDQTAGNLYLYPPAGAALSSSYVVGASLEELVKVVGTASQKVMYLTFSGFTFTHTHRTLFTRTYEPLLKSDWTIARAGTVYMQDAENITVRNCTFSNIGGNGVFMSGHNRNNSVQNSDFTNMGATAIAICGDSTAARKLPDYTPGPANDNYPKNINVTYCYMYDNGMFEKQTSAVCISVAESVTVSHCTAHHGPRAGFCVCDGNFGGHVFEYNDLFDQVRETLDHGPFNSWMRDRWNGISNVDSARKYALLDVTYPVVVRNNRISNLAGVNNLGVDWDDASSNFQVYENLLINCGCKLQHGFNQMLSNNVIINQQGIFHQWNLPDQRKYVTHNVIVNKNPYYCRTADFLPNTGEIDSNVFWDNGAAVALQIDNGSGEIDATPTWTQDKLDVHSVTTDPQFVDVSTCNYQVKTGSPALALGFKNFPMDQFGKPGYPACLTCPSATVGVKQELPKSSTGSDLNSLPTIVFNGSRTAIRFTLNNEARVTFRLYSSSGRSINQISVAGSKGSNTVMWDAFGKLPSAMYLIEMQVGKEKNCFTRIAKIR